MGDACSARTSTAFKPPRFQESAMKLEDSISDFRKILSLATKTTADCRNPGRKRTRRGRIAAICTFTAPVAARFFWNPTPLMQNYMIKSVKMTKKSILRDQFSWKVRNFASAFRKGCRSFCCSISPTNYHLARRKNEHVMYNGVMRIKRRLHFST